MKKWKITLHDEYGGHDKVFEIRADTRDSAIFKAGKQDHEDWWHFGSCEEVQ